MKVFMLNLRTKEIRGSQIVPFLCYFLRPNTSRYVYNKPMSELPAIESFGKTVDLKGPFKRVPKMLWVRNISGSFEKRTPGLELDYLKRLENEPNFLKMFPKFCSLFRTVVKKPPSLGEAVLLVYVLTSPTFLLSEHPGIP